MQAGATSARRQMEVYDPLGAERVVHDIGALISYYLRIKVGERGRVQKFA